MRWHAWVLMAKLQLRCGTTKGPLVTVRSAGEGEFDALLMTRARKPHRQACVLETCLLYISQGIKRKRKKPSLKKSLYQGFKKAVSRPKQTEP